MREKKFLKIQMLAGNSSLNLFLNASSEENSTLENVIKFNMEFMKSAYLLHIKIQTFCI